MKHFVEFIPRIMETGQPSTVSNPQDMKKVARWYTSRLSKLVKDKLYIRSISVAMNQDKIRLDFVPIDEKEVAIIPSIITDPDDDGNHPIRIGNKQFVIVAPTRSSTDKPLLRQTFFQRVYKFLM